MKLLKGSSFSVSRTQDPGESQEKFVTDLKLWATTCNFGDLKDSLVRYRIIFGIQDRQLREELLKIPDLDLQRCLSICRAAELSKTRTKPLEEGEAVNSRKNLTKRGKVSANKSHSKSANKRRKNDDRNARDSSPKEVLRCKFCGGKHRAAKKSCPAFGRRCSACGRMNHFATQCLSKTRVNVVESESESELDEYCLTLHSVDESQVIRVHMARDLEYAKKLFATINVENTPVKFQLYSGATCDLIPAKFLGIEAELFPTRKLLAMYNNTIMKPLGTCTVAVSNPKNSKTYQIEFVVEDDDQPVSK